MLLIRLRLPAFRRSASGFTLAELGVVLGVVGLILGAIWVALGQVSASNQVRTATQQLISIVQNVHTALAEQSGVTDNGGILLTQSLDQLRVFPMDMRQNSTIPSGIIFNTWSQQINGGAGTVFVGADNCAGVPNTTGVVQPCFSVSFLNIPQNACVMLVTQSSQGDPGLQEVMINGADAGDANGGPPLPVPADTAAANCNNGNINGSNDIVWIYLLKGNSS